MLAAKAAGLPMDKVKLHTLVSGGSFGRRANVFSDFTVAAVNVAKAIGGRAPVRVQFSREDDTGAGFYRPMYVHAVKAGIDAQGRVALWEHTIVGQSIMAGGPMADDDQGRHRPDLGRRRREERLRPADDGGRRCIRRRSRCGRCGGARSAARTPRT